MKRFKIFLLSILFSLIGISSFFLTNISLIDPSQDEVINLVSDKVKNYVDGMHNDPINTDVLDYALGNNDKNENSVTFKWSSFLKNCKLVLSTDENFETSEEYITTRNEFEVTNLKSGTVYYWYVVNDFRKSRKRSFIIGNYPRMLYIDGIINTRDIGGYKTLDGYKVKQGLLFRGSELNNHYTITAQGKDQMVNNLKIKTDLDLREPLETSYNGSQSINSPLGETVDYYNIPIEAYESMFKEVYNVDELMIPIKENLNKIFTDILTDPNNYPIYIHCWGGRQNRMFNVFN